MGKARKDSQSGFSGNQRNVKTVRTTLGQIGVMPGIQVLHIYTWTTVARVVHHSDSVILFHVSRCLIYSTTRYHGSVDRPSNKNVDLSIISIEMTVEQCSHGVLPDNVHNRKAVPDEVHKSRTH